MADTEARPLYHDEWLATINGEFWGVADSIEELLVEVERIHHSDLEDATARDVDVFEPGASPNWMGWLAAADPETYEQQIETDDEAPSDELKTMEGFL